MSEKTKEYWEGYVQATYESVKAGYGDAHPDRELEFYITKHNVNAGYRESYDEFTEEWEYVSSYIELENADEPLMLETWMMNLIAQLQTPPDLIDSSERYLI